MPQVSSKHEVIHIYPNNPSLQYFHNVKIVSNKAFSRYARWVRLFYRKYVTK